MKPLQFKIAAPKTRRHRALYDEDLPFRPRREDPKTVYRRRPKHPLKEQE